MSITCWISLLVKVEVDRVYNILILANHQPIMILRDIVERPLTSSPFSPPPPPKAPSSSQAFPPVLHRSLRKPPKSAQFRHAQPDTQPEAGPSKPRAGGTATQGEGEYEQVRQSVDVENRQRVESMSQEEREEEIQELKERFGPGLLELMRKRREGRVPTATQYAPHSQAGVGEVSEPLEVQEKDVRTHKGVGDIRQVAQNVDEENRQRVQGRTEAERKEEVEDLAQSFGKTALDTPKARAEVKLKESGTSRKEVRFSEEELPETTTGSSKSAASKEGASSTSMSSHSSQIPSPATLRKYMPDAPIETDKLAWLEPAAPSTDSSPRFDLSGRVISAQSSRDLPAHLGLHHHGSSPDLAGYTLDDILYLCQSSVPAQRIAMMAVLARVIHGYLDDQHPQAAMEACKARDICGKGVQMASIVIEAFSRNAGMVKVGVELLFEALGGSSWDWMGQESPFRPELPDTNVELDAIQWDDLLPVISELLVNDAVSPSTAHRLVRILRRMAHHSAQLCETVIPLVLDLVRTMVLQRPWPSDTPPSTEVLSLVLDAVTTARTCAAEFAQAGVVEPLLKYIITLTWDQSPTGMELAMTTLKILYALGRYGLASSIAKSGSEALRQFYASRSSYPDLVCAYLACIEVWITCATDPHRTTPEHDLTWAQMSALGYVEDILESLRSTVKEEKWTETAVILRVMAAWVKGAEINGVRAGEDEKAHARRSLADSSVVEVLARDEPGLETVQTTLLGLATLLPRSIPDDKLATLSTRPAGSPVRQMHLLSLEESRGVIDQPAWTSRAFDLIQAFRPGDEPLALDLLDQLLVKPVDSSAISHKDGLQILRPLLQYTILPDVTQVLGPSIPSHQYLKATSTLRPSPPPQPGMSKREGGLPLPHDWIFSPLDELLASGTSVALAQTPPDWDPSELDLVKATLILGKLSLDGRSLGDGSSGQGVLSRSELLLNIMKVYMLEHGQGQQVPTNTSASDIFRDPTVSDLLKDLVDLTCLPIATPTSEAKAQPDNASSGPVSVKDIIVVPDSSSAPASASVPTTPAPTPTPTLEATALPFLGPDIPFYQFFTDFVALYESISFSDPTFTRLLFPPLAMSYPVDYRRLIWCEHPSIIRGIRTRASDVPLESALGLLAYFKPSEIDKDVLNGMIRALLRGWVKEGTFLWEVAIWHLAKAVWEGDEEGRESTRVGILVGILSSASDAVVKAVMGVDLRYPGEARVDENSLTGRKRVVEKLTGSKGLHRLEKLGL